MPLWLLSLNICTFYTLIIIIYSLMENHCSKWQVWTTFSNKFHVITSFRVRFFPIKKLHEKMTASLSFWGRIVLFPCIVSDTSLYDNGKSAMLYKGKQDYSRLIQINSMRFKVKSNIKFFYFFIFLIISFIFHLRMKTSGFDHIIKMIKKELQ